MIKRFLPLIAILMGLVASGQEHTSSPYSFFGVGLPNFNGSAKNRSMEGLSISSDSIHLNFNNPAALGDLQLTNYTMGGTHTITHIENQDTKERSRNTSFDYAALAIPAGKLNFAFGLAPYSAVGYELEENTSASRSLYKGSGGINKVFLSFGYQLKKNLRVGIEGNYNFGKIKNNRRLFQEDIQYGTREKNRSDLSGFKFKIGAQYERKISRKLNLKTSAYYSPKTRMTSKNKRELATIVMTSPDNEAVVNERKLNQPKTKFDLPSDFRAGAGIGKKRKWFVGLEYENIGKLDYTNTSFDIDNVNFKSANAYRLGGYFTPNRLDVTNYLNRITLRAGVRYQELGMRINNEDLDEFGISFGLGLPAGEFLSNINIGAEYGQRGTTSSGLIKENFVNIFIGLSFNDKWFREKRYH